MFNGSEGGEVEGEGLAEGRAGWRWLGGRGQGCKAACSVGAPPPSAPLLPSAPLGRFASFRSLRPRRPGCVCARGASGRSLLLLARGSVLAFRPLRQSPAAIASVAAVAAAPLRAVAPRCVVARSLPPACVLALPRVAPSLAPLRSPASLRSSQSLRRRRRHCRPCKPPCIPAPTPRATASHRAPARPLDAAPPARRCRCSRPPPVRRPTLPTLPTARRCRCLRPMALAAADAADTTPLQLLPTARPTARLTTRLTTHAKSDSHCVCEGSTTQTTAQGTAQTTARHINNKE